MEMEVQTAAVAIVTPLLELVLTARAAVTFLTKNTVTKLAQTQAQTQRQLFTDARTVAPPITIHKRPLAMGPVLTQPVDLVDVCVLDKQTPTETEVPTAVLGGATQLLVLARTE